MENIVKVTEFNVQLGEEFPLNPSCTILKTTKEEDGSVTILLLNFVRREN